MSRARTFAGLLVLLVPGASHAAQLGEGGVLEIGTFASVTPRGGGGIVTPDFGAGARGAWFITRPLSLEVAASRTLARRQADAVPVGITELGASLIASARGPGAIRLLVGTGYSRLSYGSDQPFADAAAHAIVGARVPLSQRAALRLDARIGYTPSTRDPRTPAASVLTAAVTGGISVFFAERPPRDTDGDLIADRRDQCPATPAAAHVDARGCPRDGDADRVFDGLDRCGATPAGARVDATGCPLDGDRDGVPDGLDRCEGTTPQAEVDAGGCEVRRDSDSDGVLDRDDRCPGTSAGQRVDQIGCPILFEERGGVVAPLVLRGVTFELDQAILTTESHAVLNEVAASLLVHTDVRIEVAGHTDDTGSLQRNASLSLGRAEAVRAYLASRGVATDRMVTRGYGATVPVASNATEDGRALNRRVELRLREP